MSTPQKPQYQMQVVTNDHADPYLTDLFFFRLGQLDQARTGDIEHVVAPAPASYWLISVPARSIVERLYGDVCGMVDEACDHDTGFEIHPFELTFKPLFSPRDVVGDNLVGLIYYHEQSLWQVTGIDLRDRAAIVRVQRVCRRDVGDGWRMDVQAEGEEELISRDVVISLVEAAETTAAPADYTIDYMGCVDTWDWGVLNTWRLRNKRTGALYERCFYCRGEALAFLVGVVKERGVGDRQGSSTIGLAS